jgi:hypothetical protein
MHERVELPDPVTLVGDTAHEVLLIARPTTPANPFAAVTVIVEVPAEPALAVTLVGLAVIVKSWTTYVTVTECERLALLPVTPTWYVPVVAKAHERVEEPDPVTLVGEMVQEVLLVAILTTPAKPLIAATVIVEVPADPALAVTLVGLAAIVKSWTTKEIETE